MKRYMAELRTCSIKSLQVIRESQNMAEVIDEHWSGLSKRISKCTESHIICDTFDAAKDALYAEARMRLITATRAVDEAKQYLAKVDALQKDAVELHGAACIVRE